MNVFRRSARLKARFRHEVLTRGRLKQSPGNRTPTSVFRSILIGALNIYLYLSDLSRRLAAEKSGSVPNRHQCILQVRSLLRRFPFWASGHLRLGQAAFEEKDIILAHNSARACLALDPSGAIELGATELMAKAFLASGKFSEAADLLKKAVEKSPQLKEDLAAAYMGLNEVDKSREVLSSIPDNEITPQGRAALDFLKQRDAGEEPYEDRT